jgi:hypothetical protein
VSDAPVPAPVEQAQEHHAANNGLPPVAIMQRMLELQEKRMELDSRQLDINERELDNNKSLGLRSMELNAAANTERTGAMVKIMGWRYIFWGGVAVVSAAAIITALILGKEAVVIEALKYLAVFVGGYGTNAVVQAKKKNAPAAEEES